MKELFPNFLRLNDVAEAVNKLPPEKRQAEIDMSYQLYRAHMAPLIEAAYQRQVAEESAALGVATKIPNPHIQCDAADTTAAEVPSAGNSIQTIDIMSLV